MTLLTLPAATLPTPTARTVTPPTMSRSAVESIALLRLFVAVQTALATATIALVVARSRRLEDDRERGQATTEYALILLAAALVGLLVVAWATAGGGAARITRLFNGVIDAVIDKV